MECHSQWNVTQNGMSLKIECLKMECHSNGMSLEMEFPLKWNVTKNGMSLKWNVTQNEMLLKMECH